MKICGKCVGYGKHAPTEKDKKENKLKPCRTVADRCNYDSPACALFQERK